MVSTSAERGGRSQAVTSSASILLRKAHKKLSKKSALAIAQARACSTQGCPAGRNMRLTAGDMIHSPQAFEGVLDLVMVTVPALCGLAARQLLQARGGDQLAAGADPKAAKKGK